MDKDLQERLDQQDIMLQRMEIMVRRMYRIFLATIIGSAVVIIIPLIILTFVLPKFISTYSSTYNELLNVPGIGL